MSIYLPEHLGPDAVGRGAGWRKTNVGTACSMALHDLAQTRDISFGELLGGVTETLIAMIQASAAPSEWREAGHKVTEEINRRMVAR